MKTKESFQAVATEDIESLRDLINDMMPDKGLKEEDSQKICLLHALLNFEQCINGVTDEDFKE